QSSRSIRRLAFDVMLEPVEDGLPAGPLLLAGMLHLGIEADAETHAVGNGLEGDGRHALSETVFDASQPFDPGIGAGEIEAHAAVARLHARREAAALPEVDACRWSMPVVGRRIPLHDVF